MRRVEGLILFHDERLRKMSRSTPIHQLNQVLTRVSAHLTTGNGRGDC